MGGGNGGKLVRIGAAAEGAAQPHHGNSALATNTTDWQYLIVTTPQSVNDCLPPVHFRLTELRQCSRWKQTAADKMDALG